MTSESDADVPADVDDDDEADSGDRMLLVLLESTDPAVEELGRRVLEGLGFQVDPGIGSAPALVFDYQTARFAVISVGEGASALDRSPGGSPGTGTTPPESPYGLFAAVLSGQKRHEGTEGLTRIEPDADGAWTDRLVETIRLLGWLT